MTRAQQSGYRFEKIVSNSIRSTFPDPFIYKIMDTHSISGLLKKLKDEHTQYENFLVPKVPADFITIIEGKTIWIEAKSTKNLTSFPLGNIKEHQLETSLEIESAGGIFYFIIRRDESRNGKVWAISPGELFKLRILPEMKNKKSIKWSIFDSFQGAYNLKRVNANHYDMTRIASSPLEYF